MTQAPDDRGSGPPPRPGVEVISAGGRVTVVVTGVVDRARATEVSGALRGLVAGRAAEVVVDLTHACDGAALLPALARTRADLVERGGALWLAGVAVPEFLAALVAAPLEEVFLVYDAVSRDAEGTRRASGRGGAAGSARRRTDWPHPSRAATGRPRALRAVTDWWTASQGRGAHRAR
ncbi:hypothetical protein [Actinomycetospora atypica]|uniref:STAS domain-containing protein n=1 Tax=Actinomycetospora atypica TaxID=1290095 RepID=A0ABV9YGK3_9PSEU